MPYSCSNLGLLTEKLLEIIGLNQRRPQQSTRGGPMREQDIFPHVVFPDIAGVFGSTPVH
jgi:hypothetical protein